MEDAVNQRFYIDTNSGLGRSAFKEERIPYKSESLLDEMSYYRVHASLVYSLEARDYSFVKGNNELLRRINKSNRLFGIATVIPSIQYELNIGYKYFDDLLKKGIKGFKLYPKSHNYQFSPFIIEYLAKYMIDKDIPLVLDLEEINWIGLEENLKAFPELKILLCNTSWAVNRDLFPLLEEYENLYFDISSNQANDILETTKKHFGTDRVVFGTAYPNKVIGALKALIEYSKLDEDEKDNISFKNAAKLFKIEKSDILLYKEQDCKLDSIARIVDNGKPLNDLLVIDSHTHLVDKDHFTVSDVPMINGDEDCLIKKMDSLGIDKIIISPWEGIKTDGVSSNKTSLSAIRKYKDKIEVYATFNPNYIEDLESTIDIYHEKHKFIGLKPYWTMHKIDLLDEKYRKWFEYGNKNKLIMLVHSGKEHIAKKVGILSEMYKDMSFLLAHTGISYEVARWNTDIAKKRDNVYLEITYTNLTNGIIEYMVEQVGADKVLFGTDMPMRDPAPQLAWVAYAKISIEDKKKILGENMAKIIKRTYDKNKETD